MFFFHAAGGGNPESDNAIKLIAKWLPESMPGAVALIECGQGYLARLLATRGANLQSFHSNWIDFCYAEKNKTPGNLFADFARTEPDRRFDTILFRNTKSATHNLNIISRALAALTPDGKLYIAGGNKDGIKGLAAKLVRRNVEIEMVANGKGCRVLACSKTEPYPLADESLVTSYNHLQAPVTVRTVAGLFSHGKSDLGSGLLLDVMPGCKKKSVLDLGCGSGLLGLGALRAGAVSLTATDISAMALAAAQINLAGLPNTTIVPSYIGDCLDKRFNLIFSNPPFHEGKATSYALGEEWLDNCRRLLTRRGALWLVASEFLKYKTWGDARFSSVERITTRDRFTVYRMSN